VRGVQVHGAPVDEAQAGQRTALNLQRVELGEVERGMVVAPPGVFLPTSVFDVHLELLASAPGAVVRRKRIRFHTGTAELIGYVVLLGQDTLLPGESAFAQVLLERPTFALPGDRFIVRQYSPMATIGGGEILDARPRRHRRSEPAIVGRLEKFRHGSREEQLASWIEEAGARTADLGDLVGRLGVPQEEVRLALQSLSVAGRIRVLIDQPMTVVDAATFASGLTAILEEVRRFHAAEPLVKGIGREELRGHVLRGASPALFRALLEHLLETRQLAVDQDVVHAFERHVTLGGEDARIRGLLADRFQSLGLQAPSADEVIAGLGVEREIARKIVQLMVKEQALVRISADTMIDRNVLQKLIDDVKALKPASPRFGVREFKDLTGLSRKFALPLLEYLDGQRVTRRVGDERIIL